LIEQGQRFKGFYIILEGAVRLGICTADGRLHDVADLGAGDFFGETLLLRARTSPFSVVVLQDMKALFIERETMLAVVENNPRLATEMNRFIEARTQLVQRSQAVAPAPAHVNGHSPQPEIGQ
jgi:CRP-like cAMP-binding protein